jgi:hypothetical protein
MRAVLVLLAVAAGCGVSLAQPSDLDADDVRRADLDDHRARARAPIDLPSPEAECRPGTIAWSRAPDLVSCATPCRSDDDCVGFTRGDERCRLLEGGEHMLDEPVFVDTALADELDAEIEADAALVAADAPVNDDGTITVEPDCDENCEPIDVPAPTAQEPLRLCDEYWDLLPQDLVPMPPVDTTELD